MRRRLLDAAVAVGHWVATSASGQSRQTGEWIDVDGETVLARTISRPEGPDPAPLVIGLHGFGSDEHQLETLVPLSADLRAGVHYLSLRGAWTVQGGGHAWFPIGGSGANDFAADSADVFDSTRLLAAAIEALAANPAIDPERVWLIGYSQGASLALHTLWRRPDLLAGVAVGAGAFLVDENQPCDLSRHSCFVAGSSADRFVSEVAYADLVNRLRSAGAAVQVSTEAVPHVISTSQARAIDKWLGRQLSIPSETDGNGSRR